MNAAITEKLDDQALIQSLQSTLCPACGGHKNRRHTFCGAHYYKLPRDMRVALYSLVGFGYREAVLEALDYLKVETPRIEETA